MWLRLKKKLSTLSNHKIAIKSHDIHQYDVLFRDYPDKKEYENHRSTLSQGIKIGMMDNFPMRLSNDNPKFSTKEKIGIGQQLHKWLNQC